MAAEDKEDFLSRWSRLKQQQAREAPDAPAAGEEKEAQAPVLPPVDQLTPESDFSPFMQPKVAQALRRVALKKLFSDPHFNVPDLNEAYSGDWTGGEPISEELLKTLNQARTVLYREEDAAQAREAGSQEADSTQAMDAEQGMDTAARESVAPNEGEAQAAAAEKPKETDGTGRQDA
jgi:hypothetical protein